MARAPLENGGTEPAAQSPSRLLAVSRAIRGSKSLKLSWALWAFEALDGQVLLWMRALCPLEPEAGSWECPQPSCTRVSHQPLHHSGSLPPFLSPASVPLALCPYRTPRCAKVG